MFVGGRYLNLPTDNTGKCYIEMAKCYSVTSFLISVVPQMLAFKHLCLLGQ